MRVRIGDLEDRDPREPRSEPPGHPNDVSLEEEQTPEAVHDTGDRGHEVNHGHQRGAEATRRYIRDEQRSPHGDREGYADGDEGDQDGSKQDGCDTELAPV